MPISASNKGLMIPHTVSFERLVFIFHKKMPVLRDELTKDIHTKYYKHLAYFLAHKVGYFRKQQRANDPPYRVI